MYITPENFFELYLKKNNMKFKDMKWHHSVIKNILIDRRNPGINDIVSMETVWSDGTESTIVFIGVYTLSTKLDMDTVRKDIIDEASIDPIDDDFFAEFKKASKCILKKKLHCYRFNMASSGTIKIIAEGFKISDRNELNETTMNSTVQEDKIRFTPDNYTTKDFPTQNSENLSQKLDRIFNIPKEEKIYDRKDVLNLFSLYFDGEINEDIFEDRFYKMYTKDGATNFTEEEHEVLRDLGDIIIRFSPYEQDHITCPGAYINEKEFKESVIKAKKHLDALPTNPRKTVSYRGMTVNERLYESGQMNDFENAVYWKDTDKIIKILKNVQLDDANISAILERNGLK